MNRKIAIVTGASRGIGREIAKTLAKKGYQVVANYNKSEKEAEKLKDELKKEKIEIDIYKADVSQRLQVKEMIKFAEKKFGKIDIIINNAWISQSQLFTDVSDEDWNNIINNNLYSAFCVTQEVLPNMIHNKSGCIINISSIWGLIGASCESIYSISKAGIDAMTKSLAKELGPSNIRVNSIAPGFIDTDMNKNLSIEDKNEIINDTPLQKLGKPEDIVKCIEFLIEEKFITGQVLSINGGWGI